MELKLDIGFDKLLQLVSQLSEEEKEKATDREFRNSLNNQINLPRKTFVLLGYLKEKSGWLTTLMLL